MRKEKRVQGGRRKVKREGHRREKQDMALRDQTGPSTDERFEKGHMF